MARTIKNLRCPEAGHSCPDDHCAGSGPLNAGHQSSESRSQVRSPADNITTLRANSSS